MTTVEPDLLGTNSTWFYSITPGYDLPIEPPIAALDNDGETTARQESNFFHLSS